MSNFNVDTKSGKVVLIGVELYAFGIARATLTLNWAASFLVLFSDIISYLPLYPGLHVTRFDIRYRLAKLSSLSCSR